MKENFSKSLAFVLDDEKGYINDPSDRGGETNMGISKKAHPQEDIKNLTLERATEIYHAEYWMPIKGDELPSGVDYVVFDSAVNHGPGTAVKFLQKAANRMMAGLTVDGIIGSKTLDMVKHNGSILITDILRERDIFYSKIVAIDPTQERFMRGWRNRLSQVTVNARTLV